MRNLIVTTVLVALAACGPGSKEVAGARTARYKGDKVAIFNSAKSATEAKYKIAKADEPTLTLQTIARVFDPNGLAAGERAAGENSAKTGYNSQYPDNSLIIAMAVSVQPDGDAFLVQIKPIIERYHAGSPQTEPLTEGDISLPGWVQGKVDSLALDIHEALKQYEVKTVPGAVPPPSEPAAAPPASGSAAPAGSAS